MTTPVVSNDLVLITSGYPKKIALALKAGGSGDVTGTSRLVWSYNRARHTFLLQSSMETTFI